MKRLMLMLLLLCGLPIAAWAGCPPLLDHDFRRLASDERVNLCEAYGGKVVLVVNTASRCGFTPQYDGLEKLYSEYGDRGLVVVGFPSNDFGGQEPGSEEQIKSFCRLTYGVEFPMFEKTHVARHKQPHALFQALAAESGEYPSWNFHKYLVSRDGRVVGSYRSGVRPQDPELVSAIEAEL